MGKLNEYVKMAVGNIRSNKGRSFLTMLGIIIGISSVIMVISIGDGAKNTINKELDNMAGGQLFLYISGKGTEDQYFTLDDMETIERSVPHVKSVTMSVGGSGTVKAGIKDMDASITGGTEGLEFAAKQGIAKGKYFTESDVYAGRRVCVITEGDAKKLFGTTDVLGMTVEVTCNNITQDFTIVALREDSPASMLSSVMSSDRITLEMPYTAVGQGFAYYIEDFYGIYIIGDAAKNSKEIADKSIQLMERIKRVKGEDIIQVENFADYMSGISKVLGYVTIFIVFVAAISLLVGGIGVMNIMLVSVTERTREIGIRKALGAKTNSIMTQFLLESAIITLIGGIIGITLGVTGAVAISAAVGFTPSVKILTILIATLFSSGVGIVFGVYPARKAAKLSPIEALRHE